MMLFFCSSLDIGTRGTINVLVHPVFPTKSGSRVVEGLTFGARGECGFYIVWPSKQSEKSGILARLYGSMKDAAIATTYRRARARQ